VLMHETTDEGSSRLTQCYPLATPRSETRY